MLLRFAYLAVTHAFAVLRLLPMTDREKDVEILALRQHITVPHRQLGDQRLRLRPEDRAFLAALLVPLSRVTLRRLRLLVSPDTSPPPSTTPPGACGFSAPPHTRRMPG